MSKPKLENYTHFTSNWNRSQLLSDYGQTHVQIGTGNKFQIVRHLKPYLLSAHIYGFTEVGLYAWGSICAYLCLCRDRAAQYRIVY